MPEADPAFGATYPLWRRGRPRSNPQTRLWRNSPWRTIHLYKTFKNNNFASSAPLLVKPNV